MIFALLCIAAVSWLFVFIYATAWFVVLFMPMRDHRDYNADAEALR